MHLVSSSLPCLTGSAGRLSAVVALLFFHCYSADWRSIPCINSVYSRHQLLDQLFGYHKNLLRSWNLLYINSQITLGGQLLKLFILSLPLSVLSAYPSRFPIQLSISISPCTGTQYIFSLLWHSYIWHSCCCSSGLSLLSAFRAQECVSRAETCLAVCCDPWSLSTGVVKLVWDLVNSLELSRCSTVMGLRLTGIWIIISFLLLPKNFEQGNRA